MKERPLQEVDKNKKGDREAPLKVDFVRRSAAKLHEGGAEGSRTPVQTYPPKAFYMLIS